MIRASERRWSQMKGCVETRWAAKRSEVSFAGGIYRSTGGNRHCRLVGQLVLLGASVRPTLAAPSATRRKEEGGGRGEEGEEDAKEEVDRRRGGGRERLACKRETGGSCSTEEATSIPRSAEKKN